MSDDHARLTRLAHSRWATRQWRATQLLRDADPAFAVPLLRRLLSEGRTLRVIAGAAGSLGAIDDPAATAALGEALDDPDEWVRLLAAEQLAAHGEPRARGVLLAAFATDDIDQFGPAVDGLCHYGDGEARRALEQAVADEDAIPLLREVAANGLAAIGTRESLPALHAGAVSRASNASARSAAERSIAAIERPAPAS